MLFAAEKSKLKKAHYIALGFVVILTLVLLRLPERATAHFKLALGSVFAPLFGLAGSAQHLAGKAGQAVVPARSLARENEELHQQNDELRLRLGQADLAMRENERLSALLGWARTNQWRKVKLARVIARDPANWWRNIHVDLGRRDGVHPDLAVLTAEGLAGRVVEVSETRSRVVLLGDPNCRVAAVVLDEGRKGVDNGVILGGASVVDPSVVELSYLSRSSAVKPGQIVETSGLGGVFPKGLIIGRLVDCHAMEYGIYTGARVKLAVNLNQLEEVWVLWR